MNLAKRLRLSQTAHGLKHKVRIEASNPCSLLLKNCEEKISADRNPWGKPRRTHKNKRSCSDFLNCPRS